MSERTQKLREVISGMSLHSNDRKVISELIAASNLLLDEIEAQQNMVQDIRAIVDSHYQRQGDAMVRLAKEIDRLKGTHGA